MLCYANRDDDGDRSDDGRDRAILDPNVSSDAGWDTDDECLRTHHVSSASM